MLHDFVLPWCLRPPAEKDKVVLEMSVLMTDRRGILSEILSVLYGCGVDVKFGAVHPSGERGEGWSCFFLNVEEKLVKELLRHIESIKGVKKVVYSLHRGERLIIGENRGIIRSEMGDRLILLRTRFLGKVLNRMRETWGDSLKALLYVMGVDVGKEILEHQKSQFGDLPFQEHVNIFIKTLKCLGWISDGEWSLDNERISFKLRNLFVGKGEALYFIRGEIAGFLSSLMGKEYRADISSNGEFHVVKAEPGSFRVVVPPAKP